MAIQNMSTLYRRPHFTVSFTSLKIEFNPIVIWHMAVSIKLSTVDSIFKETVYKATQEIVEYNLEYRRKSYIKPCTF